MQDNNNSKIFFGVKMRKFLIFFAFLVNLISSVQARLLSESEMTDFIDNNEENISHLQKQYGIHKGYSVIEVAKQEIIKRTTSKEYREKCKDIIFSALNGIGLGGVDETKKANPAECRFAYLALYTIGINAQKLDANTLLPYIDGASDVLAQHREACNDIIKLAHAIRIPVAGGRNDPSILSVRIADLINGKTNEWNNTNLLKLKIYKSGDFLLPTGELAKKYLFDKTSLPKVPLGFDESVDRLLGNKTILSNVKAANIIKEFNALQKERAFQEMESNLKYEGTNLTIEDKDYAKKAIFGFFLEDKSVTLGKLLTVTYDRASLRPGVSKELKRLHIFAHPDKASEESFIYDSNIPTVLTSLTAIIDECKDFTISVAAATYSANFLRKDYRTK